MQEYIKVKKVGLSNVFEAVGQYEAGLITRKELNTVEDLACPTCGSCAGMYTANTMNCLTEALGMGLPGMVQYLLFSLKD